MSFYREHVLPWLIDLSMRQLRLAPYRSRVVSAASGRVLEIGIGSGLNLAFYGNSVRQIIGIEPSAKLLRMARAASREISMPLDLIEGTAEAIPIDDRSIDTVVTTWTCSKQVLPIPANMARTGQRHVGLSHFEDSDPGTRLGAVPARAFVRPSRILTRSSQVRPPI
jgi:SAM-dependent methyltransferase